MRLPLPLLVAATLAPAASAQVVVDWDFSGILPPFVPDAPTVNPLLVASGANPVAGFATSDLIAVKGNPSFDGLLWATSNAGIGELNHKYWDGDNSDIAGTASDGVSDNWIEFTLNNTQGSAQSLERLSVSAWRNGTGAPGRYVFEIVADGGAPQVFGSSQDDPSAGDFGYDWFHFDDAVTFDSDVIVRFRPVATLGGQGTGNLHVNGLRVEAGPAIGAPDPTSPNVLFIIADDLTATALGCYGNAEVETPNLDTLAAGGMKFERAYCQYPVCATSRPSILSGTYPSFNPGGAHPHLPEHFRQNGYTSARVSKVYHMRVPGDITSGANGSDHAASWDTRINVTAPEWMTPGIVGHYTNESVNTSIPTSHYSLGFGSAFYAVEGNQDGSEQADAIAAAQAVSLLGDLADEPFFLAVGLVRPHVPLVAPASSFSHYTASQLPLAASVPGDLADIPPAGVFWNEPSRGPNNDADRREVLRAYYASVTFMDEQVGVVLDRLEELGLDENTIVVFTSDHGYHLGEHTFWQKLSLHEESAAVPLIIRGPGVNAGSTDALTELIDLYPTLADMAGLDVPNACQGTSLRPVLETAATSVRDAATTQIGGGNLLRTDDWAYMRYNNGTEELYDMQSDPLQFTNLANNPAYGTTVQELSTRLTIKLGAASSGSSDICDNGIVAQSYCVAAPNSVAEAGARISLSGSTNVLTNDLGLTAGPIQPGEFGLFFHGASRIQLPFGEGFQCTSAPIIRILPPTPADTLGFVSSALDNTGPGGVGIFAGVTRNFQLWYRDPLAGDIDGDSVSSGFSLSNALEVCFH